MAIEYLVTRHIPAGIASVYSRASPVTCFWLAASNILLFGQDLLMFFGLDHGRTVFVAHWRSDILPLHEGLLVPQAWTLGVELAFYIIAPVLLRRRQLIYVAVVLSLGLRLAFIRDGFGLEDPWTYRFFPTELALFAAGALAHQILLPAYLKLPSRLLDAIVLASPFILSFAICAYGWFAGNDGLKSVLLLLAVVGTIPVCFLFSQRVRLDVWLGELSYPIYIVHMLVIWVVLPRLKLLGVVHQFEISSLVCVLTVISAVLLNSFVAAPFEQIRRRIKARANMTAVNSSVDKESGPVSARANR